MTRDEYFTYIYKQRGRTLRWLRSQGVPEADAEILVDRVIIYCIEAFDRGRRGKLLLRREVPPWLFEWKRKNTFSIDLEINDDQNRVVVPLDVEAAEREKARAGRSSPKPEAN